MSYTYFNLYVHPPHPPTLPAQSIGEPATQTTYFQLSIATTSISSPHVCSMPTAADYPSYTSGGPYIAIPSLLYTPSSGIYLTTPANLIITGELSSDITRPGRHGRGTIWCFKSPKIAQTSMPFSTTPAPFNNPSSCKKPALPSLPPPIHSLTSTSRQILLLSSTQAGRFCLYSSQEVLPPVCDTLRHLVNVFPLHWMRLLS